MKKVIIILTYLITLQSYGYQYLLEQLELKKMAETYKEIENFAALKIWYWEQSQPKIFSAIEIADKATDLGYFRIDYHKASNSGKLFMLREYFNLN